MRSNGYRNTRSGSPLGEPDATARIVRHSARRGAISPFRRDAHQRGRRSLGGLPRRRHAGGAGPHHEGRVVGSNGGALATWDWQALSALRPTAIANEFAYNRFKPAPYGLEAGVGARAVVTLPPPADADAARAGAELRITDVAGKTFAVSLGAG
jgi:hypothetical protein